MHCQLQTIGLGFLVGSVLTSIPRKRADSFETLLNPFQMRIYQRIQQERFHIYMFSLFISLLVVRTMRSMHPWMRVILFMTLTASLYMTIPKSIYMADFLNTEEQRVALRQVYRDQQFLYYGSITLATMAAPLLCA
jgi:hypothetical protein